MGSREDQGGVTNQARAGRQQDLSQTPATRSKRLVWTAWFFILGTIPFLSLQGRALQRWLREILSPGQLAALLLVLSLALALSFWRRIRVHLSRRDRLLLVLCAVFLLLFPLSLPVVEERVHVLLFAIFGLLCVYTLGPWRGAAVALAVAGLDELLQYALPDRVGDLRDVGINALSAGLGGMAGLIASRKK